MNASDVYQIIKWLCDTHDVAVTKLESDLGFGRGSIGKMQSKTKALPSFDRLQKIADYFGVSVEIFSDVQKNADEPRYYISEDTARKAQELFENPDMRLLFDAAEGSTAEDLQMAADLLMRLKRTNG